eukprot:COSAG02_NODE_1485_length_12370_cov_6.022144_4_plen_79_part_00
MYVQCPELGVADRGLGLRRVRAQALRRVQPSLATGGLVGRWVVETLRVKHHVARSDTNAPCRDGHVRFLQLCRGLSLV